MIMSKIYHMHIVPFTIPENRYKESFHNCCGKYLICCKLSNKLDALDTCLINLSVLTASRISCLK